MVTRRRRDQRNRLFPGRRWDGANWYNALSLSNAFFAEPFDTVDITMDAVAAVGSNIYVGGRFNYAQGDQNFLMDAAGCPNIFCINNGGFASLGGTGVNSNVLDMAAMGTNLYVAGYFTNAGGNFTNMGGVSASRAARWDGNNWWALGSGLSGPNSSTTMLGLCSSANDLYAGGGFQVAGNKPSFNAGHWNDHVNFNTPQLINPKWLQGEQFQARLYGVPGVTNIVQATTNFTVWTPVLTNSAGIYDFTDSNSSLYRFRFYRGVLSQ